MEKLNQVWEKLSLDGLVHGEAEIGLGETESEWFGHGAAAAVSGLGEIESGWFGSWNSLPVYVETESGWFGYREAV